MKKTANSNMYEVSSHSVWESFGDFLSGSSAGWWCVVSAQPLDDSAQSALEKSAAARGFGKESCTFVTLIGKTTNTLSAQNLFAIIEGIDPVQIVVTDIKAVRAIADAYRQSISVGQSCRLFGRDTVAFNNFELLLSSPEGKQKAWRLLKKLPRFDQT